MQTEGNSSNLLATKAVISRVLVQQPHSPVSWDCSYIDIFPRDFQGGHQLVSILRYQWHSKISSWLCHKSAYRAKPCLNTFLLCLRGELYFLTSSATFVWTLQSAHCKLHICFKGMNTWFSSNISKITFTRTTWKVSVWMPVLVQNSSLNVICLNFWYALQKNLIKTITLFH